VAVELGEATTSLQDLLRSLGVKQCVDWALEVNGWLSWGGDWEQRSFGLPVGRGLSAAG